MHQGCYEFAPFADIQCTAIAFMFLLMIGNNKFQINNITNGNIDRVLYGGTALYSDLADSLPHINKHNSSLRS